MLNICNKGVFMKKSILFVTNHLEYSNGVASVLVDLVNALDKDKYDVTILAIFRCDKEYIQRIDKAVKVKSIFNGYFRGQSKLLMLLPKKALYKSWVKENYDVEIAFQYGLPTELIAKSCNKNAKQIAWIHTYGEEHLKIHKFYDLIVSCSKSGMEKYKSIFSQPQKVTYLYNLVKDDIIQKKALEELNVEKKYDFTFCAVGRLSPEKGFDRLLRCHKRLIEEGYLHNLWIVGGGSEYDRLNAYIQANNLGDSARLFGAQKNPFNYMANCDMFLCSSRAEGFATVCVEAGIIGKSILSTDVSGAKEFVYDNKIGLMVQNDEDSLYQGMKEILQNKDMIKLYEANLSKVPDMHYADRLRAVEEFFERKVEEV